VKADPIYGSLYLVGGVAAAVMVLFTILHTAVFFVVGLPDSVLGWFELFEGNALGGLLAFELLLVGYVVLSVPLALALYATLHRANPSLMSLYLALALIGSIAFIASRPAFEMLSLSNAYAAATTEAQRAAYVAAGEATIAAFDGTAYWTSYILGSVGGIVISVVMLQVNIFSKTTAYLRLASGILDFGIFVPTVGLFIALLSVFCLLGFNILAARRLLQLARVEEGDSKGSDA
jgi:fumarate reductase subunit D